MAQLMNPPSHVIRSARAPQPLALCPGAVEPGAGSLNQHRALEFREHAGHAEERSPRRCRCVYALLIKVEVDPGPPQRLEAIQQLSKRPAEPRNIPRKQDVKTAARRVL